MRRERLAATMALGAAVAVVACVPPASTTASRVVAARCAPELNQPYSETITSTATPPRPRPGATVRFELGVRRLQLDVGPLTGATYGFEVPAGVSAVRTVEFDDDNPNTWTVQGRSLTVEFRGPDGGWLVNDFPRITIVATVSPSARAGDRIDWKPYRWFEQRFLNFDTALSCTPADPALVLQTMVVHG